MKTLPPNTSLTRVDPLESVSYDEDSTGLQQYGHMLRRRKGLLIWGVLFGALAGLLFSLPQTPTYQARSTVEIQGSNRNILNTQDVDPAASSADSPLNDTQTQVKMFQSESLIEWVLGKLNKSSAIPSDSTTTKLRQQALAMAAGTLQVKTLGQSRLLEIRCESTNAAVAAEFINMLTQEFTERTLVGLWKSAQRTVELLSEQMTELKSTLENSEAELQKYASDSNLQFTSEKNNVAEEKLRQLQDELSKSQAERVARQSRYETANARPPETLPEVLDDPAIQSYQSRISDLRRQLAELGTTLTPAHYKIQRLQAQIEELQAAIKNESVNIVRRMQNEYDAAARREKLLTGAYSVQSKLVSDQSTKGIRYNILRHEVDANRELYHSIIQKVKEYGIASALRASNVRVVDPAVPPAIQYKPTTLLNTGVGMLGGLFFGFFFMFIKERTDRSIKLPGESSFHLNVRELGVIPASKVDFEKISVRRRQWLMSGWEEEPVELATWQRQPTLVAESFRSTLASILFTGQNGDRPHVMVITSTSPQEGKTTVVSNLGVAIAEINRRVLLIDCDLRRPRLHNVFSLANSWGLTDLLREVKPIKDYPLEALIKKSRIPNLWILPSGPGTANISGLLHSSRMVELLDRLRTEFEMVLIDTPPMLQISDARILGRLADGVILVFRAGRTVLDNSIIAARRFGEDGTPVVGVVLNDWDPKKHGGYGYDKAYYDYIHGKEVVTQS